MSAGQRQHEKGCDTLTCDGDTRWSCKAKVVVDEDVWYALYENTRRITILLENKLTRFIQTCHLLTDERVKC